MAIKKSQKIQVIEGIHKGKKGVCKDLVGNHHLTIEFEDGRTDVILIVYVKKA